MAMRYWPPILEVAACCLCKSCGMGGIELTGLHLDVYDTRQGLWNPEHGDLEIPDDWDFLPTGDAFVTRRVKAAGTFWVAWRPRGHNRAHRRRLGLWAPRPIIEAARVEAADTAEERAKSRVHSTRARERREAAYQQELEDAIRRFLAFDPAHADLEGEIGREAAARAAEVGSGRVGRTQTLSLQQRAALAARALIRHRHTSYEDALLQSAFEDPWDEAFLYREVKAEAQLAVDDFLERHRSAPQ